MGRAKDKLTARQVASLKAPGMHSDGDRAIIETAAGTISRHWVFLYVFGKHLSKNPGSSSDTNGKSGSARQTL